MANHSARVLSHPEVQSASTRRYIAAFVVAMVLMVVSCLLVVGVDLGPLGGMAVMAACAGVTVVVQLVMLFKLDLSEEHGWHTVSLVLTFPLFVMSVGLTLWMFHTLELRTMVLPGS